MITKEKTKSNNLNLFEQQNNKKKAKKKKFFFSSNLSRFIIFCTRHSSTFVPVQRFTYLFMTELLNNVYQKISLFLPWTFFLDRIQKSITLKFK